MARTRGRWPTATRHAVGGMVCSVDHLASSAGVAALRAGGTAVDAAIAASAVLAVTTQHLCGLGGDLFALVHEPGSPGAPAALRAAGRAGSGATAAAAALRAEGHTEVPAKGDVRAATVPGCVDGWVTLHARGARLPLADLLAPAIGYAGQGFPASPLLVDAAALIAHVEGADAYRPPGGLRPGSLVVRSEVADVLEAIASGGRDAFYRGRFGAGLVALGAGLFDEADLAAPQADWVEPIAVRAWDHDVWTVPPPSQGYLSLAGAWIADGLALPDDPDDGAWVHLLAEAARWAGHDRPQALFDGADGAALLDPSRLGPRRAAIDLDRRTAPPVATAPGDTIHLCTADGEGGAVSLIQSNADGWGAQLVVPGTGVLLHDRGIGFSLEPGHPAEMAAGRRPPHTLSPASVTTPDGRVASVLGTMGGDMQPQVVLQLLARLLRHGEPPGDAVSSPRWILNGAGFATWTGTMPDLVALEDGSPGRWGEGLLRRGHRIARLPPGAKVGHAHVISLDGGVLAGAADPRALTGGTAGF